jgi:hypothetical protein
MKVRPVVADTGRPASPFALNLLNAGWMTTRATPAEGGGFSLNAQVVAIFLEAPWNQLNRPHRLVLELIDEDGVPARFSTRDGLVPARTEYEIVVPQVPGAPHGTPGGTSTMFELSSGFLRLPAARRRYRWRVTVGGSSEEVGFWVDADPPAPTVG